jgi:hypothetical protein
MSNLTITEIIPRKFSDSTSYEVQDNPFLSGEDFDFSQFDYFRNQRYRQPALVVVTRLELPTRISFDLQSVNPEWEFEQATNSKLHILEGVYQPPSLEEDPEILVDPDLVVRMPPKSRRKMVFKVLNRRRGQPSSIDDNDILWDSVISE